MNRETVGVAYLANPLNRFTGTEFAKANQLSGFQRRLPSGIFAQVESLHLNVRYFPINNPNPELLDFGIGLGRPANN